MALGWLLSALIGFLSDRNAQPDAAKETRFAPGRWWTFAFSCWAHGDIAGHAGIAVYGMAVTCALPGALLARVEGLGGSYNKCQASASTEIEGKRR